MENICRTCARIRDNLQSLFESERNLPYKILILSDVEIVRESELPNKICKECIENINLCYNFRTVIQSSDLDLKERCAALKNQSNDVTSLDVDLDADKIEIVTLENIKIEMVEEDKIVFEKQRTGAAPRNHNLKSLITYKKRAFKCSFCDFGTTNSSLWHNHKRSKQCNRKVCNICGKMFRADNLLKHIRTHSEPPIECPDCKKVFKNKESLRSHQFLHRNEEFICEVCGKSYKIRGEYNRHLNSHNPNREKKVKCPMCDKMFYDTKHIRSHMLSHTGERPHLCKFCQKGFISSYALKTHIRLHTKENPYMCEFCPMAYPQKVSLNNHIKTKHMNSNETKIVQINESVEDLKFSQDSQVLNLNYEEQCKN